MWNLWIFWIFDSCKINPWWYIETLNANKEYLFSFFWSYIIYAKGLEREGGGGVREKKSEGWREQNLF